MLFATQCILFIVRVGDCLLDCLIDIMTPLKVLNTVPVLIIRQNEWCRIMDHPSVKNAKLRNTLELFDVCCVPSDGMHPAPRWCIIVHCIAIFYWSKNRPDTRQRRDVCDLQHAITECMSFMTDKVALHVYPIWLAFLRLVTSRRPEVTHAYVLNVCLIINSRPEYCNSLCSAEKVWQTISLRNRLAAVDNVHCVPKNWRQNSNH